MSNLGGPASGELAINDAGQAVGEALNLASDTKPTLWQPNGPPVDLGSLGQPGGTAWGINNVGQVVGTTLVAIKSHAFLWQNGSMADLGVQLLGRAQERPGSVVCGAAARSSVGTCELAFLTFLMGLS
jgi:probable HAF family extracellular repeat protein